MCNIHFDEQAVRCATAKRAQAENVSLYQVDPARIYRDLYDGQPIGGIKLYFIHGIKNAMVKEAIREAFLQRVKQEHRDLNQISEWSVAEEVLGACRTSKPESEYWQAVSVAQGVMYDMMIEEAQATRAE
jgi:hypothetical protein